MPWQMFWMLYGNISHVAALDRLNQARAVSHAIGIAFAGKDGKITSMTNSELREAFPNGS